jgi:hypothetical protein
VKMSASCLSVSINSISISPFSTWSLRKWCLTLMCLAPPWKTELWARHMVHSCRSLHKISWFALSKVSGSSSYILDLCGGLCNRRLLVSCPTYKRRSEKIASTKSALSVNPTPHEISIRKLNKIKRRKSIIPNPKLRSLFEVPEDSLNCRPM